MQDEFMMPMLQPLSSKTFTTEVRGQQHTYYLTGDVTEPDNYVDLCNLLRSCSPQDEVLIRINSRGGSVASERMIVNAIQECQGTVVAYIEYFCMSAATGVFLAAHHHAWADHIQFMVHCAFWGSIGKNPDVKSQTEFGVKQLEEEINSTYKGLLSDEELVQCNEGKEFWFGAKELEERMKGFLEYRNSLPSDCGSAECPRSPENMALLEDEEDFEVPTLEDMIANAVQEGISKALAERDRKEAQKAKKAKPKSTVAEKAEKSE